MRNLTSGYLGILLVVIQLGVTGLKKSAVDVDVLFPGGLLVIGLYILIL